MTTIARSSAVTVIATMLAVRMGILFRLKKRFEPHPGVRSCEREFGRKRSVKISCRNGLAGLDSASTFRWSSKPIFRLKTKRL